ncbi:hemolysin family protein [Microbacterium hatanonis]|uniref:HlyC/CorC family transporter n=1 Tax=Microbacterium hatanonis TaxID=404366 RepID=A0A5C8HWC0_9MICO|nr:hemolysin family protein [Microbacterium hatanonis]TXK09341.1 HlyC/CorC family transporter [Microbacterium hatanonis]
MSGDLIFNIVLVLVFVLIGGVFAATEMALVTLRESQLNAIAARGKRGEKVASLARNPNRFLSAVQIGVTVAGFLSAAYGASSISPYLEPLLVAIGMTPEVADGVSTVVLTLVIAYFSLVLGELVPKRLAIQRNAQFSYAVAPVLNGFAVLMRPVIWLLSVSTNALVRLLGGDPDKNADEMTDDELRDIVSSHGGLPEDERRILDDVLSLRDRQISEVMRPRLEVIALDVAMTIADAVERVQHLPYSRYPITDSSIDDIIGFVHVRDLYDAASADPTRAVSEIAREISYLPASSRVLPTLTKMRAEELHIAVVVDEYGGTDGIVTLEDLVEEVVGEIFDEYDVEAAANPDDPAGGTFDGRLNLQDFEEASGVELERGTYDTLAGFIMDRLGRIPAVGDTVAVPDATLRVQQMERRRVAEVAVIRTGADPDDAEEAPVV